VEATVAEPAVLPAAEFDRRGIGMLSLAHIVNDMNQSALPAIIPWLIAHRGLTLAAAATLVLAMNLSSSVVQPLFGHLSDRRSLAWVIAASLLLATFGTAAIGLAPTLPLMLLGALIAEIGVAAFHPEASRFANYFAGARRATGMSAFTTGGYLGFAVGPIVITPLLVFFGLHGTAFLALPGAVFAWLLLRELPRFEAARTRVHHARRAQAGRDDWRAFSVLGAVIALRSTAFFGAVTFMPVFAIAVAHVDRALGAVALAAMLIGGAAGTMWGGRLADRFDRRAVVVVSLIATFASAGALAVAGAMLPVFALLVSLASVLGVALGLSAGVIVVIGQEYLPQRIGVASGVTLGLSVTIGGLAAPLFGAIGDRYGLVPVIACVCALAFASLCASVFLPKPAHVLAA
jgi:FSR family fosmidomycin resistance protein-like MFS transporter